MKAAQITEYGKAWDVVKINDAVNVPKPLAKQILVEVYAASINPFDFTVIEGRAQSYIKLNFPATVGGDFSGIVTEVGSEAKDYARGDEVFGQGSTYGGGSGAFAEFLTADIGKVSKKPKTTNFLEAASLPLVGQSAIQVLDTHIKIKKGQKILVHGGAGGIGSIAIQIAKARGAYVATTVAKEDFGYVKSLGADLVLDYKSDDFTKKTNDYDAVFNTASNDIADKSLQVVKKGGVVVSMTGQPDEQLANKLGVRAIAQNTQGNSETIAALAKLVDEGKIKPQIDKVLDFDETAEALRYFIEGHPNGKVVVKIR